MTNDVPFPPVTDCSRRFNSTTLCSPVEYLLQGRESRLLLSPHKHAHHTCTSLQSVLTEDTYRPVYGRINRNLLQRIEADICRYHALSKFSSDEGNRLSTSNPMPSK